MKLMFISSLVGDKYTGPTTSVPSSITAQSKIDEVIWFNFSNHETIVLDEMVKPVQIYEKKVFIDEFESIKKNIDFIIIEEFFKIKFIGIIKSIIRSKIPYIIVPRCQITDIYMNHKKIKKSIAYLFFYKKLLKNAHFIQFLTEEEKNESSHIAKNMPYIIVPNGINLPDVDIKEKKFENGEIEGVFIGRLAVEHKGIDLLVKAVNGMYKQLKKANIHITLYGPNDRTGNAEEVNKLIGNYNVSDIISINGPVYGKEKNDILFKSDFFVCTSRYEGLPMSVLEALSFGNPCLVTRGSNLYDEIFNNHAGWCAENDVDSIKKALDAMIKSYENGENLSINAYELAKKYTWDNAALILENRLKED